MICCAGICCVGPAASQPASEQAPPKIALWSDGVTDPSGYASDEQPVLHVYRPPENESVGTGVVVAPGGGYVGLAVGHEGRDIAEWLNGLGIAAFVLDYRRAPDFAYPAPIYDGQRAVQYVRYHAEQFGIEPDRVGMWGFSAGGHLTATVGTREALYAASEGDSIGQVNSRPEFLVLAYPVITMLDPYVHAGSRRNLLGDAPGDDLLIQLANEKQVSDRTPPTFLFHTSDDPAVPPENSVAFYLALREAGVPVEMHIYETGRHGVGLAPNDPVLSSWSLRLRAWLDARGYLCCKERHISR